MKSIILILSVLFNVTSVWAEDSYSPENLVIDNIICSGNVTTDCKIIGRELYLEPGQKISEVEITNARIRLSLLGLFDAVNIQLKKGQERGHVVVDVGVIEGSPYFSQIRAGPSFTTGDWFFELL
jgi:outer membrane protein assembly factor BamA